MSVRLIEYLATARLGERGTMTLPKEYRDEMKLETGAPLTVLQIGSGLILMPEQSRFDRLCDSIASRLENDGITESALQSTLPEVREDLMRRHYPKVFSAKTSRSAKVSQTKRKR